VNETSTSLAKQVNVVTWRRKGKYSSWHMSWDRSVNRAGYWRLDNWGSAPGSSKILLFAASCKWLGCTENHIPIELYSGDSFDVLLTVNLSIFISVSQYHHTYRCDDNTRGCVMQFWPSDDEHTCSKHVEAWNKIIIKQKLWASIWLITEIKKSWDSVLGLGNSFLLCCCTFGSVTSVTILFHVIY